MKGLLRSRELASGLIAAALAIAILLPILWGFLLSLKTRVDALATPPTWVFAPTLENYRAAFVDGPYGPTVFNSLIIAGLSAFLAMCLGVPAAYAFSRGRFRGRRDALLAVLAVRMAPATVVALPLFVIYARLRLIDSYVAIVSVHTAVNLPLAVWIMKGFFDEVPTEIDEASLLDGDTRLALLLRQLLPVSLPGVFATSIFCFINSWNEFFLALMLTGYSTRPFTVAIPALITPHGTYWGQVAAIATVGLMPGALFAVLARRYLVKELTVGAIWR